MTSADKEFPFQVKVNLYDGGGVAFPDLGVQGTSKVDEREPKDVGK